MENLTFSTLKRAHGLLRFLWPVQSWRQARMMAAAYAVALPTLAILVHLDDPREPTWDTLLVGALCGTVALFMHLPATLEVTTRADARHFVGDVSDLLSLYGYERCGNTLHFVARWPRWLPDWLRWLRCPESDVDLCAQGQMIVLRGPRFVLRHLRRRWELAVVGPRRA